MVKTIPVRAIREGFIYEELRNPGDTFEVKTEKELGSWMERLDGGENPAQNKHLIAVDAVANKTFEKIDTSKLEDESKIQVKAEKEVKKAQADVGAALKKAPANKDLF